MKKPSVIFIDLDGTSLDSKTKASIFSKYTNKTFSKENINAIKTLSNQIPIVVSTGRGNNSRTKMFVDILGLKHYITSNGANIVVDDKVIYSKEIEPKIIQELYDFMAKTKMCIIMDSDWKNKSFYYSKFTRLLFKIAGYKAMRPYSEFKQDKPIYKILLFSFNKNKVLNVMNQLNEKFGEYLNPTLSGTNNTFIEITAKGVSKGLTEEYYCKIMNYDPKDAIHIGDSMNDASTKNLIGKVVALKNSVKEFKDIADEVYPFTCKNHGLAKYLSQFIKK